MYPVLGDTLYIAQGIESLPTSDKFRIFKPDPSIHYHAFCDDFGPMNLAMTAQFITQLDAELADHPSSMFFYCVDEGKRELTNAVFLLGAYMIMRLEIPVDEVMDCFSWVDEKLTEDYRDATFSAASFELTLEDCWRGLAKGMQQGWVGRPCMRDDEWGMIDMEEYIHYEDPLNGDLHKVVPGKFVALKGPRDLGALEYSDDAGGFRRFSPSYYVDILQGFGVTTVVRLNEPEYDAGVFAEQGIAVLELPFDDCAPPPPHVAEAFLAAVDGAGGGSVAVHCKAGLGRTGTLIALYLMRSCGFRAREAMGWLRIMRPGSVIGEQQHYLCAVEQEAEAIALAAGTEMDGASVSRAISSTVGGRGLGCGVAVSGARAAAELAREVAEGMVRRGCERARRSVSAE